MSASLAQAVKRLATTHASGVWIGAVRQAFEAGEQTSPADANVLERYPAHYLVALWEPLEANRVVLPRWPAVAAIASPDANAALLELVRHLPQHARVWLCDEAVDWALIAEIVLRSDRHLEGYQRLGVEHFIERCRQDDAARIASDYSDRDAGFDAFRNRLLPKTP